LTRPCSGLKVAAIDRIDEFPGLSQHERMQEVLRMLETRDSVQVAELAETFSVSEVTVRSDLSALAKQGLVARVRGGVRALRDGPEVGFDLRLRLQSSKSAPLRERRPRWSRSERQWP